MVMVTVLLVKQSVTNVGVGMKSGQVGWVDEEIWDGRDSGVVVVVGIMMAGEGGRSGGREGGMEAVQD